MEEIIKKLGWHLKKTQYDTYKSIFNPTTHFTSKATYWKLIQVNSFVHQLDDYLQQEQGAILKALAIIKANQVQSLCIIGSYNYTSEENRNWMGVNGTGLAMLLGERVYHTSLPTFCIFEILHNELKR